MYETEREKPREGQRENERVKLTKERKIVESERERERGVESEKENERVKFRKERKIVESDRERERERDERIYII